MRQKRIWFMVAVLVVFAILIGRVNLIQPGWIVKDADNSSQTINDPSCVPTESPVPHTTLSDEMVCLEVGARIQLKALFTNPQELLKLENTGSFTENRKWVELTYNPALNDVIQQPQIRGLRWVNHDDGKVTVFFRKEDWQFIAISP